MAQRDSLPRQSECPDCGGPLVAEAYEDAWFDDHYLVCEDCGTNFEYEDFDCAAS